MPSVCLSHSCEHIYSRHVMFHNRQYQIQSEFSATCCITWHINEGKQRVLMNFLKITNLHWFKRTIHAGMHQVTKKAHYKSKIPNWALRIYMSMTPKHKHSIWKHKFNHLIWQNNDLGPYPSNLSSPRHHNGVGDSGGQSDQWGNVDGPTGPLGLHAVFGWRKITLDDRQVY